MQPFRTYLVNRQSSKYTVCLILVLLAINILQNKVFGIQVKGLLGNYGLPLLSWALLVAFIFWLPRVRSRGRLRQQPLLIWLALVCVLITILGFMVQGAMSGFGKSPYDHSPTGILINVLVLGTTLVGTEMARAWLMNRHFVRYPLLGVSSLAVVFTLISYPWNKFLNISTGLAAVKFVGSDFLPTLAQNLLATYLAFLGGPLPPIIYRGGVLAIERLSPVLPMNNWAAQTLIGIVVPVLGILLVRQVFYEENKIKSRRNGQEGYLGWTLTAVISVLVMWFAMGVFSYSPQVIITGSMQPAMNIGDVAIVHKLPKDKIRSEVQVDDIILFPMGEIKVIHRVIGITERDGNYFYATKGDANDAPDSGWTLQDNVLGKVVMVVPKAGWPSLLLRGAVD
ncbi:MAG: signal peptidase I [Syntrophomonadales bacterium]